MKSAYAVLGIPGNASADDIEQAYLKASAHYSDSKFSEDKSSVDKVLEVRDAYKLLSNPEMRAAHDRKLTAVLSRPATTPRVVVITEESPWHAKPLNVIIVATVMLFAIGAYMTHSRNEARRIADAKELADKKAEALSAEKLAAEKAQEEAQRALNQAKAERQERQLRAEGEQSIARVAAADRQQQAAMNREIETKRRETQQLEAQNKAEERQRISDAQRRLAADQQRIRELCYQQYRKPIC